MKIEITKEQYQTLLELVFMGNWVVNSMQETDAEQTKQYDHLEKLMFSKATEFELGELADDEGYPSRKFEEESPVYDYIEEYDNHTFWDELTQRLAKRDLLRQYGKDGLCRMSAYERIAKEDELIDAYYELFEKEGLDALLSRKNAES